MLTKETGKININGGIIKGVWYVIYNKNCNGEVNITDGVVATTGTSNQGYVIYNYAESSTPKVKISGGLVESVNGYAIYNYGKGGYPTVLITGGTVTAAGYCVYSTASSSTYGKRITTTIGDPDIAVDLGAPLLKSDRLLSGSNASCAYARYCALNFYNGMMMKQASER